MSSSKVETSHPDQPQIFRVKITTTIPGAGIGRHLR
jgi:hypothetical protein